MAKDIVKDGGICSACGEKTYLTKTEAREETVRILKSLISTISTPTGFPSSTTACNNRPEGEIRALRRINDEINILEALNG